MEEGVRLADPARLDVRGDLSCAHDVSIDVNCVFMGQVSLGEGVRIGANCVIANAVIEAGAVIHPFTHIDGEKLGVTVETFTRVTGFGQVGPRSKDPGYGTLAEAMSGFAHSTGEADGPPTLPPLAMADNISALAAAVATLIAVHARGRTGRGQVVDLAIIEPILSMLGPQITVFDQLGIITTRKGNRSENNAPRNTYKTSDGHWVAIASSSNSIAERVLRLVGRPELIDEPWFSSGRGRAEHAELLDDAVGSWIGARTTDDVLAAFSAAEAALARVYDVSDVVTDPQYAALGSIATVEDATLGPVRMPNIMFRLSDTPGEIRHSGRGHGEDTDDVLREVGLTDAQIADLRDRGIV